MSLRLRVLPRFPARISGISGLSTYRDGPDLVIKSDYGSLVRIPAVDNEATTFFKVWNEDDDSYSIMTFEDVFSAIADLGFLDKPTYDPQNIGADAFARANQTGVQAISTVTGLQAALDAKLNLAGGTMTGNLNMAGFNLLNAREGVPDYLNGLITVRGATSIAVGTGWMKAGALYVKNTITFTKSLSAPWAAGGGGNGALDQGSFSANATYFLHAIRKNSDSSFDWLSSLSPSAPLVPAGYTLVGRFWTVIVASSVILDYTQSGNKCLLTSAIAESTITTSFAKALVTLSGAPNGLSVDMLLDMSGAIGPVVNASVDARLYDGYLPSGASSQSAHGGASSATTANSVNFFSTPKVRTNTSRQVYQSVNYTGTTGTVSLTSLGWEDWQLPRIGA